jgi:hypothetical protein
MRTNGVRTWCGALVLTFVSGSASAVPAVGVASFEDGTSTSPVAVWYSPGSVMNVAGGHEGARSVAATGNIRIHLSPATAETRLAWWMKGNAQTHINGVVQYFNGAWQTLREDDLDLAADGVWREQIVRLNKPAGTVHVFAAMSIPNGVTVTIDDVTGAADNPAGAVEGLETGNSGPWSVWFSPGSVQNTNAGSNHAGLRSVAVSGNVKFGVAPMVTEARFWHQRLSGSLSMSWKVQYFDVNWVLLSESAVTSVTSDTTWQQATVAISAPANARYVLVAVWPGGSGDSATVHIDDFSTTPGVQPARRPFANGSPWNVLAAALPLTLESHPELDDVHWWVNSGQYSFPVVNSAPADPAVAVSVPATWGRPAQTIHVKIPAGVTGATGTDAALQVNDMAGVSHSFWQFVRLTDTTATAQSYGATPLDGDGFTDPATGLNAGIRAAAASPMGGLLSGPEIAAGEIEHALAVSLPNTMLKSGWVAPARAEDADGATAYLGSVPIGSRLVVPGSATMPAGLSALGQKIWRAAQKYGFLVVDRSGTPALYADPRTTTNAQIDPLRAWWCPVNCDGTSDLDLIVLQLQLAKD